MDLWDVKRYIQNDFQSQYKKVAISKLAKRYKHPITLDDNCLYKQITIKLNGQGVILRSEKLGRDIKTNNQYIVRAGQFVYSKIDARNGAFGLVPKNLDGAIITNSFSSYEVDPTLIQAEYLYLIASLPQFSRLCERYSSGTTGRRNISDQILESIQIPLPPLSKQTELVEHYQANIRAAESYEAEAQHLENNLESDLFEVLGIEQLKEKKRKKGLQFVQFKDLDRWDVPYLFSNIPVLKSKYPVEKFSNVISFFNKNDKGASIRINPQDYPNDSFYYIGMKDIEKATGELLQLQKVKGSEIKSQCLRIPKSYLLFGKLRPYLNKYWVNNTDFENIICSSEFFVFDIKSSLNKSFFKSMLSSSFIQTQIMDKTSGARMPRIHESIFFKLQFPLPPLHIQQAIADHFAKTKTQIKRLRREAGEKRRGAKRAFEGAVFGV